MATMPPKKLGLSRINSISRDWGSSGVLGSQSAPIDLDEEFSAPPKVAVSFSAPSLQYDDQCPGVEVVAGWTPSPIRPKKPAATAPAAAASFTSSSIPITDNNGKSLTGAQRRRLAILGTLEGDPTFASTSATKRPWEDSAEEVKFPQDLQSATVPDARPSIPSKKKKKKGNNGGVELSDEQTKVLNMVVKEGKSVFFTGSAGTGKSVLLREIIKGLRVKYATKEDAVAVTASTGIAACNVGGTTLHSFSGVGLGLEAAEKLAGKVRGNRKASGRWSRVKVLIIDEVSMVDGDLFDKLSKVAQIVRHSKEPFGGIQLVVTGDFFQLPPVTKGGNPRFAFEAQMWEETINKTVNLTQVFRQKDQTFVNMLNEMRFGKLTLKSIAAFKSKAYAVAYSDGIEPTDLFPRREEVEESNSRRLRALTTESVTYQAQDGGEMEDQEARKKLLSNMMAVEMLTLKVGAQVMLIKNLDDNLVNGSIGRIRGFYDEATWPMVLRDLVGMPDIDVDDDPELPQPRKHKEDSDSSSSHRRYPAVEFIMPDGPPLFHLLKHEEFKVEDSHQKVVASRIQIPLILSWAMSIHKSQGQTIPRVRVDLSRIFEKGQAYVALSRAISLDSLQVIGFDAKKVECHPKVAKWNAQLETL